MTTNLVECTKQNAERPETKKPSEEKLQGASENAMEGKRGSEVGSQDRRPIQGESELASSPSTSYSLFHAFPHKRIPELSGENSLDSGR